MARELLADEYADASADWMGLAWGSYVTFHEAEQTANVDFIAASAVSLAPYKLALENAKMGHLERISSDVVGAVIVQVTATGEYEVLSLILSHDAQLLEIAHERK